MRPTRRSSGKTTPSRCGTACSARSPPPTISPSPTARGCWPPPTWPPPTPRSAAGTTNTTTTPGARSPPSARPTPTPTPPPPPTPPGRRCLTPPHPCAAGQAPARHAAVSREPIRPQLRRRRHPGHPALLLWHQRRQLHRNQQQIRDDPNLPQPLRRAAGKHQRTRLGRHPLPHRRPPRRQARHHRRPLPPPTLLPTNPPPPPRRLTHPTPGGATHSTPPTATQPATSDTARRRSTPSRNHARDVLVDACARPNESRAARDRRRDHPRPRWPSTSRPRARAGGTAG